MLRFGSRLLFLFRRPVAGGGAFPLGDLILLETDTSWLTTEAGDELIQE